MKDALQLCSQLSIVEKCLKRSHYLIISQWLEGNSSSAVAIRKDIGLDDSLPVEQYSSILGGQMSKNFTASKLYFTANCSYAKYILTSWNAKRNGDAFMYAVSVISTVGKIYYRLYLGLSL